MEKPYKIILQRWLIAIVSSFLLFAVFLALAKHSDSYFIGPIILCAVLGTVLLNVFVPCNPRYAWVNLLIHIPLLIIFAEPLCQFIYGHSAHAIGYFGDSYLEYIGRTFPFPICTSILEYILMLAALVIRNQIHNRAYS